MHYVCGVIFPRKIEIKLFMTSFHSFSNLLFFFSQTNQSVSWLAFTVKMYCCKKSCFHKFMKWCREQLTISACQKRHLNFGANISVSRRAPSSSSRPVETKRHDFYLEIKTKSCQKHTQQKSQNVGFFQAWKSTWYCILYTKFCDRTRRGEYFTKHSQSAKTQMDKFTQQKTPKLGWIAKTKGK